MPTDIAMVLSRKAEVEAQASKASIDVFLIICLWAAVGLVLTAHMARLGFDAEIAMALVPNG